MTLTLTFRDDPRLEDLLERTSARRSLDGAPADIVAEEDEYMIESFDGMCSSPDPSSQLTTSVDQMSICSKDWTTARLCIFPPLGCRFLRSVQQDRSTSLDAHLQDLIVDRFLSPLAASTLPRIRQSDERIDEYSTSGQHSVLE